MELKIRKLRKIAGMSQQELAQSVGVRQTTISSWEIGSTSPNAEQLAALAEALHCTPDELLEWGREEEGNPPEEPERSSSAVQNATGPATSSEGNISIGPRMKQLRKAANMSQQDLADALNVSRRTSWGWENGEAVPDAGQLWNIATVLGCTPNDIMGWTLDEGAVGIAAIYDRLGQVGRQTMEEVARALLVAQQVEEIQTGGPSRGTGSEQGQSPA